MALEVVLEALEAQLPVPVMEELLPAVLRLDGSEWQAKKRQLEVEEVVVVVQKV